MKYFLSLVLMATSIFTMSQTANHPHGINPANLDRSQKPGADFFAFANGGWQKANPIGDEYATYGAFNQLADLNNQRLRQIIEELAANTQTNGSIEEKIATLYNNATDTLKLNGEGISPLMPYIEAVSCANDKETLMSIAAQAMLYDVSTFFSVGVESDAIDSKVNLVQLWQGGVLLSDREYYLDTDEHTLNIRNAYREFGTKLFKMLYPELSEQEAKLRMNTVIRLETQLAQSFKDNSQLRIAEENYNKISFARLEAEYPQICWRKLFKEAGFPQFNEINIGQPEALKAACHLIESQELEQLKAYVIFHIAANALPYLGEQQKALSFDFFGRTLQGRQSQQPLWKRSVELTNSLLGEAVGQIYVKRHFPESAKKSMEQLVENLRIALGQRIKAQDWMSDDTKQKALDKLSTFYVKIGYPNKWKDYSKLTFTNCNSLLECVIAARRFNNITSIDETVGKPVDKDKWYMTPQTVNAYYNPPTNEICFPAGILQYPFFDEQADEPFNYGAIGVVIGHEMTHGFDDQGHKYDKDGNMSGWWTKKDQEGFDQRAQVIVDFFNQIKVLPDLNANGSLTQGENLADHGGLQVAYLAMKNATEGKKLKSQHGFTPEQRFFLAYAGVWANNIREAEIRRRTKSDPHSLARWRVNGTLPHINAWYDAFQITEKDPLFVPKDKRLNIW